MVLGMGSLGSRMAEDETEVSKADLDDIREWEARIERDRPDRWHYGPEDIIEFDAQYKRCWAEKEELYGYAGQRYHHRCEAEEVNDLGLCEEHYKEIVGKRADIKQKS